MWFYFNSISNNTYIMYSEDLESCTGCLNKSGSWFFMETVNNRTLEKKLILKAGLKNFKNIFL